MRSINYFKICKTETDLFPYLLNGIFPFPSTLRYLAVADFFQKNAKKNLVFHFGVGRHASFPQKPVVKWYNNLGPGFVFAWVPRGTSHVYHFDDIKPQYIKGQFRKLPYECQHEIAVSWVPCAVHGACMGPGRFGHGTICTCRIGFSIITIQGCVTYRTPL